jgi:beta-lactamase regulating signal transducer with metallopeptidase domain
VIDWLLGTFVATSVLVILVLLVREPVRQHFGARVAYGLWLIPAARLLMPTLTQTVERSVPASTPIQPFVPIMMSEPKLLASVAPPEPSLLEQAGGWQTILLVLWLGVALGLFIGRMSAFRRERAAILDGADELARAGSIRIVRSPNVSGPLAFGIFDPVIAVPLDFDRIYAVHEQRLALDHELAHHRSGDLVANFFAFVLLCLQWFNPLAWVAHAAFRFDQEAACDARVLDKAKADDRADYGRAIAKAASGRALLFASALDRRNTLHRRLKSMLTNPSAGRRLAGRLTVIAAVAVALPLTATRAVEYIDVPAPAPPQTATAAATVSPAAVPVTPATPAAPAAIAPIAPIAPLAAVEPVHNVRVDDGMVTINGRTKRWRELTPAERTEIRQSIARARRELAEHRVDGAQIRREIQKAMAESKFDRKELERDLAEARREIARAMREIDAKSTEIRRGGVDPEQLKASIRASLKGVESIDVEAIRRGALASVDVEAIEANVDEAMRTAEAELDRVEALSEEQDEDEE